MNVRRFVTVFLAAIALVLCVWKVLPFVLIFTDMEISAIKQSSLHRRTYDTVLRPMCDWVSAFRAKEGRLPTKEEASEYSDGHYPGWSIRVEPPESGTSGHLGTDFMVSLTVNDWVLHYQAWDGHEWKAWTD
jgi:hypothetical protein